MDAWLTWFFCDWLDYYGWCVVEYWYGGGDAYCPGGGTSRCGY